ncbi:MAG: alpha-mannosidase [Symploca sp. SIO1C4]|uniref:Alpha-mannosidase n=1 Tax=Symploca sp. SIO1C4 TaxID=2607765 RepID=A0A6B3N6H0_9CYAN|nr:alpha-mannosidase [Symploca sp. SIO1C4]
MPLPHSQYAYLSGAIEKLRSLTQVDVQTNWRCYQQDIPITIATESHRWQNWSTVQLNSKGYIVWSAGHQVMWLAQKFIIPQSLKGYPLEGLSLRLALKWWAEDAQIFVNGKLVHSGDLFDSSARVLLSSAVVPTAEIAVALRLVSPSHDLGGLMSSGSIYEVNSQLWHQSSDNLEPGFVADELAVLQKYLKTFEPDKLEQMAAAVAQINWDTLPCRVEFNQSLSTLRHNLQQLVGKQSVNILKQRRIQMLGHAHLDMAWLWTVSETWQVAQRTFESVLKLQQEFPQLTFCHSTPALYAWIEQHRPDLFKTIKQQVAQGRWEIVGGMWVEPELNLIDGESIVRQILYAQRYTQEKFGLYTRVAWVPDSFGFPWQLPQILKQGGIEYFVTQKLHWNDTTKFPHGAFWWQSPDGSQIFSLLSPPNLAGVMDTNPLTMATYAVEWETQTHLQEAFWLPGVGDHGGGPTRDMLEVASRWQQSPFFPLLEFTTASEYLQQISEQLLGELEEEGERGRGGEGESLFSAAQKSAPVWNDELYLEFHRGCYTTHADQKRWNRRSEALLYQAELFASLATIATEVSYPQLELEEAWKKLLFNQFHDILPGTSIGEVFIEANQAWQEVEQVGLEILDKSLRAIASQINLPPAPPVKANYLKRQLNAQPIIVFNSLNWQRSELVAITLPVSETEHDSCRDWEIYDLSGQKILSQLSADNQLLFLAKDIPSVGYRLFWLSQTDFELKEDNQNPQSAFPSSSLGTSQNSQLNHDFVLENEVLRVVVNPDTGDLSSIFDKIRQREVLSGAGNQLQAFEDKGQYWDAWNINPNYAQHPLPPTQLQSIKWLERGYLRQRLRVVRQLGKSLFCQDYILCIDSPVLKIVTTATWRERQVLVKAAFPLNLNADYATYETAYGAISRSTRPQTSAEAAKWEVPALRWAELAEYDYGVSLINDCKYGYDATPSQLRLTLLRSPNWPDPDADQGIHQFTYGLYPHSGRWQGAGTVHQGYELNLPLQVLLWSPLEFGQASLQPIGKLLDLPAQNLILKAFKQSQDHPKQWILRCYECHGESANFSLESDLELALVHQVDLLEIVIPLSQTSPSEQITKVEPWKIASFKVAPGKK